MNTKSNTLATNLQQVKDAVLNEPPKSPVQLYNERVDLFKKENPITEIQAHAVIVFLKTLKQAKLTPEQFNKKVIAFNNKYGLLIPNKPVKHVFNNLSKEYNYINFAIINSKTIEQSMDNFQNFKRDYNLKCLALNKKVAKYNKEVVVAEENLTEAEKKRVASFKKQHNADFTKTYNACVDFENEDKPIHKKKNYQTIKDQAEVIFRICVNFYVSQLRKFNQERQKLGGSTRFQKKDQPMFVLNHKSITDYRLNGIKRIELKKRAVKDQIKRLREAGVFTTWIYSGFQRPIHCHFNPNIFILQEGNPPKSLNADNHLVNGASVRKLHVYKQYNTIPNINKEEKKGNIKNVPSLKCGSMLESKTEQHSTAAQAYKSTQDDKNAKNQVAPPKNMSFVANGSNKKPFSTIKREKNKTISKNARLKILNDKVLAQQMAANFYEGYTPLSYKNIERVLVESNLDVNEIAELLTQDFIKSTTKIYRDRGVWVGEWIKAKRKIQVDLFEGNIRAIANNNNPNFYLTNKVAAVLNLVKKYRWMLERAKIILVKNNNTVQFPCNWFSLGKKETQQMGFFGLEKFYKQSLRKKEQIKADKKAENDKNSKKRREIRNQILIEKALIKFTKGIYNFEQFCNYILKYHPTKFNEIANMINLNAVNKC